MKRKVIARFLTVGIALLLTGAVAVETVNQLYIEPRIISSWSDLYSAYNTKSSTPPLPDMELETIYRMIQAGDWSFMTNDWFRTESGGVLYVAGDSKELGHLKLPLTVRVYDYLPAGKTYILSSHDGEKFTSEAAFASEPLTDDLFKELTEKEQAHELLFSLWCKRMVWEVTLKAEDDAWSDLVSKQRTLIASTLSLDGGEMMMMSVPAEHTDDLWLALETQTNGINLNIFAPDGFTNRVEVYSCTSLLDSNGWSVAAQNLYPSTNPAIWDATSTLTNRFLRVGNMDIDSDGDTIPDARELIVWHTDPNLTDSDDDTISDDQELYIDFTDPNNDDTLPPSVWIITPDAEDRKVVRP